MLRLIEPSAGEVWFCNKNLRELTRQEIKTLRRDVQIIFQDPYGSLNPRHRIATLLSEPLKVHRIGNRRNPTVAR